MFELQILPASPRQNESLFFVPVDFIEAHWPACHQYIDAWRGGGLRHWFSYDQNDKATHFLAGDAGFNEGAFSFGGGRHRTRWLIQLGLPEVPVALSDYCVQQISGLTALTRAEYGVLRLPLPVPNWKDNPARTNEPKDWPR